VLTLAVTAIEVTDHRRGDVGGKGNATSARDAMFAVVMIVLNGMVGLSLLLGGLRYHEQTYNLQGASAFLAVIVPISVLGLVLPNFTESSPGPTYSPLHATFLIAMSLVLYGVFLAIQNLRHREYFVHASGEDAGRGAGARRARSPFSAPARAPLPHGGAASRQADRGADQLRHRRDACAARARGLSRLGTGARAGIAQRRARRARQSAPALGEPPARLGARRASA
jgi:Ca2+/H+ antiporter